MYAVKCPECSGYQLDKTTEGIICRNCGLVIDDLPFEEMPDIRDDAKSRASLPGMASAGTMGIDGAIIKRSWLLSTREKNIISAKQRMELIASRLKLPEVVSKEAFLIFIQAVQKDLNIGRKNLIILYACTYASCIIHGIPKTALEITAFSEIGERKMLKAYRILKRNLNLGSSNIELMDYIPRFGSRLNLKPSTISLASEMTEKLKNSPLIVGKHPKSLIASALYLATKANNDARTQREIANVTGVLEVTIRIRSKEILNYISSPHLLNNNCS